MSIARSPHADAAAAPSPGGGTADPYKGKWSTLSNTTLGVLMATIDASIVLISLPDIFRGIRLNPLTPGNTSYFLWLMMGYMLVTAVLVVSFGRLGDIYGRVKMYNLGFVVFTVFSILLSVTWMHGPSAALFMIIVRILQGVGGALLMANSTAILTDAFPPDQRGLALGTNMVAAIAGSFIGLVLGGILAPIDWRLVFWISVPVGVIGTIWGYINLKDKGIRTPARIDWLGNATFAAGLVLLLIGIVYGIEPYGGHTMGWSSPFVLGALLGGAAILALFVWIETKVEAPMFRIPLFKIRAFAAGNLASLLSSVGRGGMMFILIIWLQGIWLPQHGYSFSQTPLWAGIYMLPMTAGFLVAGPVSGYLSDRFGARPFATGGMLGAAASFILLEILPVNFSYVWFALLLLMNGLAMGLFASPNRAAIMNSLPPDKRGEGAGMTTTGQNAAMVLSIGIFFTLIITGLASHLPSALYQGLVAQGVPKAAAHKFAGLPPTSTVFGAFLGYNPIQSLLGPTGVLAHLPHTNVAYLTGRSFFPKLITAPFSAGLNEAFDFAAAACVVAALASWLRGKNPGAAPRPALADAATGAAAGTAAEQGDDIDAEWASLAAPSPGPRDAIAGWGRRSSDGDGSGTAAGGAVHPVGDGRGGLLGTVPAGDGGTGRPATRAVGDHGSGLAGTVWRGAGAPVTGAAVTLMDRAGGQVARAVTRPDGRFHLAGLQPGSYTALITAPGHRPAAAVIAVNGAATTTDFTLTGTGTLTGVVRYAHRAPLAGANVLVTNRAGEVVATTVTGSDGGYLFADMPEGDYTLTARTPRHQPMAVAATVAAGATAHVDVDVTGTAELAGVVRQAAGGAPLAGAGVTLADASGHVVAQSVTGPDGRYRFTDVPEGDYTVVASGFHPVAVVVTLAAGQRRDLDLSLGHSADD